MLYNMQCGRAENNGGMPTDEAAPLQGGRAGIRGQSAVRRLDTEHTRAARAGAHTRAARAGVKNPQARYDVDKLC